MTKSDIIKNIDKLVRCYDNGRAAAEDGSFDRYTVCYTNNFKRYRKDPKQSLLYVGMSTYPFHPQGFGQHGESYYMLDIPGRSRGPVSVGRKCHLGVRILFKDLPPDCKKLVISDLQELHT